MERDLNIPAPQTSFIGRRAEIIEITSILEGSDCHLLTLVGPGGMGKTRLSIEVAHKLVHNFPDGVYFLPLAAVRSTNDALAALMEAISFESQQEAGDPIEEFLVFLVAKRMLFVLDSFEQIVGEASLLSDIVSQAPEVRLLITSRIPLGLQEEWVRHVRGLDLPAANSGSPQESSAVQLFLNRAGQVRRLEAPDLESVIQICKLVDGMPLAIELSAGWVNILTPADIAREIQQNIDILTSTHRNIDERHRSMRLVFDYSLELLTDRERELFKRLTIFSGGFSREAAVTLADAPLPVLATLVNKSLIHLEENGRYAIHDLLRQYSGKTDSALRGRHMDYFINLLRIAELGSGDQLGTLVHIEQEMENIRLAWEWAVETRNIEMIQGVLENLVSYCDMRGQHQLAVRLLRLALDSVGDAALVAVRIRAQMVRMIVFGIIQNEMDIESEIESCLEAARDLHSEEDVAFCKYVQGIVLLVSRRLDEARFAAHAVQRIVSPFKEARETFKAIGNAHYEAETLAWMGFGEQALGNIVNAQEHFRQSLTLREKIGDRFGMAWAFYSLCTAYYEDHRFEDAAACAQQGMEILREFHSVRGIICCLDVLTSLALCNGDFEKARLTAKEELALSRGINNLQGEMRALRQLSILASVDEEEYSAGMALARQFQAINDRAAWVYDYCLIPSGLSFAACGLGDFATMRNNHRQVYRPGRNTDPTMASVIFGVEVIARAQEGNLVSAVELLAVAQQIPETGRRWMDFWKLLTRTQADLVARLGADTYTAAWECGSNLSLDETLAGIVYSDPLYARRDANQLLAEPLTEREAEVLSLVASGLSNLEIADRLTLSKATIKVHTKHIYQKLGVTSRTQAVARATEIRLI